MATAAVPEGLADTFQRSSLAVKDEINDITRSGKYYVSPELKHDLRNLDTGIDQMQMDTKLLANSREWNQKFSPELTIKEKCDALQKLGEAGNFLQSYKQQMNAGRVNQLQENELRQSHHWASENLRSLQNSLQPNTETSYKRLHQFADSVGVTDRYSGYRNNLTRPRHEMKLESSWTKQNSQFKQTYYPQPVFGPSRAKTDLQMRPKQSAGEPRTSSARGARGGVQYRSLFPERPTMHMNKPPKDLCIQEQCGINMTYPGITEYMDRYITPDLTQKQSPFVINPKQDFTRFGRPLMDYKYEPNFSEYQTRYQFPDGASVVKLPWLKK